MTDKQKSTLSIMDSASEIVKKVARKLHLKNPDSLKESLEELIDEHGSDGKNINPEEHKMLRNVLSFADTRVGDIMIPRAYVIAVDREISLGQLKKAIIDKQHTRIPVYRGSLDDVMGFIHIKDLVKYLEKEEEFKIEDIIRNILFVPPSMSVIDLMSRMRTSRVHMALVLDEYGGTSGLVTLEDLIEEIFGEIRDEHDKIEKDHDFASLGTFSFEASARMPIDQLQEKIGMKVATEKEREDFDTIGGLIFSILGKIPAKGDIITHRTGIEFEIIDADLRKIKRVLIRKSIHDKNASANKAIAG